MKTTSNPTENNIYDSNNRLPEDNLEKRVRRRTEFYQPPCISRQIRHSRSGNYRRGTLIYRLRTAEARGGLTTGDAALLRFPAALEILEADFWIQYNELGGVPDPEVPGGTGNAAYTAALAVLDSDMAQIHPRQHR